MEEQFLDEDIPPSERWIIPNKNELIQNLFDQRRHLESLPKESYNLKVAGHQIRFFIHHDRLGDSSQGNYLTHHLQDFLSVNSKILPDLEIHYIQYFEDFSNEAHPIWQETDWRARFQEFFHSDHSLGPVYQMSQRDFVGLYFSQQNKILARGPKLSPKSLDTLDNLIAFSISPLIGKGNTLSLHAATIVLHKMAWVFYGKSGAGKSTLAEFTAKIANAGVISADQVFIELVQSTPYASPHTVCIPGFPLDHPQRVRKSYPIAGIIELVQNNVISRDKPFIFSPRTPFQALPSFLRELILWPEFINSQMLLDQSLNFLSSDKILIGQMSYYINFPFWKNLFPIWEKNLNTKLEH